MENSTHELLQRMQVICDEIYAKSPNVTGKWDSYEAWREIEDGLEKQVYAIDKEVGEGVQIGRVIAIPHADGYAQYWVYRVGKSSVKVIHLPFGDAWDTPIVSRNGSLPMYAAKSYLSRRDGLKKIFG